MQVVAGYVFYDATAAFDLGAGSVDEFGAEQKIASGTVELPQRRIQPGRDRAPDGAGGIKGREKGNELLVLEELGV